MKQTSNKKIFQFKLSQVPSLKERIIDGLCNLKFGVKHPTYYMLTTKVELFVVGEVTPHDALLFNTMFMICVKKNIDFLMIMK